jgi:hypothetical protein
MTIGQHGIARGNFAMRRQCLERDFLPILQKPFWPAHDRTCGANVTFNRGQLISAARLSEQG